MGRDGNGVTARPNSIRISFMQDGERRRETLTVAGKPLKPTPPNLQLAHRVKKLIDKALANGTFTYAEFFPDSPRAAVEISGSPAEVTFGKMCETWLATKGRLSTRTLDQYRNALGVWQRLLGAESSFKDLTHAKVAARIGATPWKSAKLLNNYLIPLRGVFALAGRELKLDDDPMDGIENSKHQAPAPDPLSAAERDMVLAHLQRNYDERVHAYFSFAFATGLRPEEEIALQWGDVDWNHKTILVQRALTAGEVKPIKIYQSRHVDLIPEALAALQVMKAHTFMKGTDARIFMNPVTGRPWHDERSQRDHYWTPTLRKCGIRHRRAYQTRHTYATLALMGGVNPAYISRQLGHKSAKMLFDVYAKWIDGADRGRERAKLEAAHAPVSAKQSKTGTAD